MLVTLSGLPTQLLLMLKLLLLKLKLLLKLLLFKLKLLLFILLRVFRGLPLALVTVGLKLPLLLLLLEMLIPRFRFNFTGFLMIMISGLSPLLASPLDAAAAAAAVLALSALRRPPAPRPPRFPPPRLPTPPPRVPARALAVPSRTLLPPRGLRGVLCCPRAPLFREEGVEVDVVVVTVKPPMVVLPPSFCDCHKMLSSMSWSSTEELREDDEAEPPEYEGITAPGLT